MNLNEIKNKMKNEFLILLEEEYGYREWFWFPEITKEELIVWWERLESVDSYFMTPEPLIGTLIEAKEKELHQFFSHLEEKQVYMQGHIHVDDDSYLKKPYGKGYIYHKGYSGDFNPESDTSMSLEEIKLVQKNCLDEREK